MQKIYTIEPIDALKMSIQSEKELHSYYEKAASLMKDEDARTILLGLCEHAENHRKKSIDMYSKFTGKKILFLNLDKRHKLNTLQRCSEDPNDAVRVAKRNEKEMSDFYSTISRRFLDADLRSFFRQMSSENQQHLTLLEASFNEPLNLDQEPEDEDILSRLSESHQENL